MTAPLTITIPLGALRSRICHIDARNLKSPFENYSAIMPSCCAVNCRSFSGVSFYRLPMSDKSRYKAWIQNIGRGKLSENVRLCEVSIFIRAFIVGLLETNQPEQNNIMEPNTEFQVEEGNHDINIQEKESLFYFLGSVINNV
jgi:hypothetical protein